MGAACSMNQSVGCDKIDETRENIVVIWDFDKSLINDDSDFYLFEKFGIANEIRDGLCKEKENFRPQHSLDRYSFMQFMNTQAYPKLFLPVTPTATDIDSNNCKDDENSSDNENSGQSGNTTQFQSQSQYTMVNNRSENSDDEDDSDDGSCSTSESTSSNESGNGSSRDPSTCTDCSKGIGPMSNGEYGSLLDDALAVDDDTDDNDTCGTAASQSQSQSQSPSDASLSDASVSDYYTVNEVPAPVEVQAQAQAPLVSKLGLQQHLAKIPIYEENLEIVNKLYKFRIRQIIVSCGHSLFIDTVLKEKNIYHKFESVHCNQSKWGCLDRDSDRDHSSGSSNNNNETLIESPYLKKPNTKCKQYKIGLCSPHMCKGNTIDKKILTRNSNIDHIIYIGDGGGDYCGLTRLRRNQDFAFVRRGLTLDNIVNNNQKDLTKADKIKLNKNNILYWNNGEQLLNCFEKVLPNVFFESRS